MKQVLQDQSGGTFVRDLPSPDCPVAGALVLTAFSAISSGSERTRVEESRKSLIGKALERPDLVRQVVEKARTEGVRTAQAAVRNKLSSETAIGYSSSGVVMEVGPEARGVNLGDRVACCGMGHANHAEICAMPRNMMAKVPDGVSLETASMATIAAIALHGVRLSGATLGERVAVIGTGLVGQITCRLLQAQGAEVFAIDVDEGRVDYAVNHGAHHGIVAEDSASDRISHLTGGVGVDAVVVTAASDDPAPLLLGAEIARDRGSLVLVGAVPIEIPRTPLYEKELRFRVSRSYGPGRYDPEYEERGLDYPIGYVRWTEQRNMRAVLELQGRGQIQLDDLVDEVIPAEQAEAAYARLVDEDLSRRPLGALVLSYGNENDRPTATGDVVDSAWSSSDPPKSETTFESTTGDIRIGLVGPGGFASRVLLPALAEVGTKFQLVGGGNGPSAAAAVREKGFLRAADSGLEVCRAPDVDAVVVATRHGSHAELVTAALVADKHVFCEKPLALDVDELNRVLEAAGKSHRALAVGFNRRFAPMMQRVRNHLTPAEGPLMATVRVSAGPISSDNWVHDLQQGGGRLVGECCHFIDTLRFLVGHPITAVSADAHGGPNTPVQARDCASVRLTFADGSIGHIMYVSQGSPRVAKERFELFGSSDRSAILDNYRLLELFDGNSVSRTRSRVQDKGHRAEVESFISAVRGEGEVVPLAEIANVSYATLAIIRSLETGAPVGLSEAS